MFSTDRSARPEHRGICPPGVGSLWEMGRQLHWHSQCLCHWEIRGICGFMAAGKVLLIVYVFMKHIIVSFLCWLLFRYPFHPCVTAVACKRPRSFCQNRRWQVTAKHTYYTLRMWLCMKWHGAWLYGVHRTCRDSSSFMWHQPCQQFKYTSSEDLFLKRSIKN